MLKVLILLLAVCSCDTFITREFEEELRNEVTWEVAKHEENTFKEWNRDEVKQLMGTKKPIGKTTMSINTVSNLPEHYDFTEAWPQCKYPVRNQASCGGCWAFAAAEQLGERFCLNGVNVKLSPQYILQCDP